MRLMLCVLAASMVAAPAFAALAPEYYEAARRNARHVVVFRVDKVTYSPTANGYGHCQVRGKVLTVERGAHYRVNGRIQVAVPCRAPWATPMAGGVIWQTPARLKASKRGRAWMETPGQLALYQYEVLP